MVGSTRSALPIAPERPCTLFMASDDVFVATLGDIGRAYELHDIEPGGGEYSGAASMILASEDTLEFLEARQIAMASIEISSQTLWTAL